MDRVSQFEKIQAEALELFKKKNADYGDAFANFGPLRRHCSFRGQNKPPFHYYQRSNTNRDQK